jgi:hypothetical protein
MVRAEGLSRHCFIYATLLFLPLANALVETAAFNTAVFVVGKCTCSELKIWHPFSRVRINNEGER